MLFKAKKECIIMIVESIKFAVNGINKQSEHDLMAERIVKNYQTVNK